MPANMEADGTLTVFAQVGTVVKKLRVTACGQRKAWKVSVSLIGERRRRSRAEEAAPEATPSNWREGRLNEVLR